jgi:hypothetical protein
MAGLMTCIVGSPGSIRNNTNKIDATIKMVINV